MISFHQYIHNFLLRELQRKILILIHQHNMFELRHCTKVIFEIIQSLIYMMNLSKLFESSIQLFLNFSSYSKLQFMRIII